MQLGSPSLSLAYRRGSGARAGADLNTTHEDAAPARTARAKRCTCNLHRSLADVLILWEHPAKERRRIINYTYTHAWDLVFLFFANAKGNMQRSLTLLCTSFLGLCLASSFPSNINIGEWMTKSRKIFAVVRYGKATRKEWWSTFMWMSIVLDIFTCLKRKPSEVINRLWDFSFPTGGLFPTESHEYEVFRFALSHHQEIPKLVPQVDMVKLGNSFSMTYACKYSSFYSVEMWMYASSMDCCCFYAHKKKWMKKSRCESFHRPVAHTAAGKSFLVYCKLNWLPYLLLKS